MTTRAPESARVHERTWSSELPVAAASALAWHARAGAFERLTPPWQRIDLVERRGGVAPGDVTVLRAHLGPFARRWVAEHRDPGEPLAFRDVQLEGPFAAWDHLHRFVPRDGPAGGPRCTYEDRVRYVLPLGALGERLLGPLVRAQLDRLFEYRHRAAGRDLARLAAASGRNPMRIAITGSSGLIGSALVPYSTAAGHAIVRLVRKAAAAPDEVAWDPGRGLSEPAQLEGVDAVVHLAGESIAGGRWTPARKERIRASRVEGTRSLATALARLERRPRVLVCASAIGVYGDRGDEVLDEGSAPGTDFLASVCRGWEEAADPAREAGIRVVHLRFGMILSPRGGALAKMLPPFRLGAGGRLGSGRQWMSWITLDDAVAAVHHALATETLEGAVNCVAPNPVPNRGFTSTLGRVLNRPAVFPLPAPVARAVFGEMADALLLASQRVLPRRLEASSFRFAEPSLEPALQHLLGRRPS